MLNFCLQMLGRVGYHHPRLRPVCLWGMRKIAWMMAQSQTTAKVRLTRFEVDWEPKDKSPPTISIHEDHQH